MSGLEILGFLAAKALFAHFTATAVGGAATAAAGHAAVHYGVSKGATHAAAHAIAHGGANTAMHMGANALISTTTSALAAGTAAGAAYVAAHAMWKTYSVAKKVEEIRNENFEDRMENAKVASEDYPANPDMLKDLRNPAAFLTGTNYNQPMLQQVFSEVFAILDYVVASWERKNHHGQLKTTVAELAPCSCGLCMDFDQASDGSSLCECACSFNNHRNLSIKEQFERGRPGFELLKAVALELYPKLNRVAPARDPNGEWLSKTKEKPGFMHACADCGCGDLTLGRMTTSCVCGHSNERHFRDYKRSQALEVDTYLCMIGDFVYTAYKKKYNAFYEKDSLFEIQDAGGCDDFDFLRWATFQRNNRSEAYCRCGLKAYQHTPLLKQMELLSQGFDS